MLIPIDYITPGDRLRGADDNQVRALAESIREVGLLSPITVHRCRIYRRQMPEDGYGLVAGLHRLEACRSLGFTEIEANVVDLDDLDRQIAECDENLCGTQLTPSERAMFTQRRKDAYEAKHPETRHGGDRKSSRQLGDLIGAKAFTKDTATKTGQSERRVQRDAQRGQNVRADILEDIRGTEHDKGTVLDRLAALPSNEQRKAFEAIREAPKKPKPSPVVKDPGESEEDWRRALFAVWNRGSADWRGRALGLMAMDPY
ncbi:ParB N-terminal domain-containing protein [Acidisoma sp. C75]